MRRAFISHSSVDAALAARVVTHLEGNAIPCWVAPRDIRPGTDYADGIVEGILGCGAMVVLLSPSAAASGQCRSEIEFAKSENIAILPVRLEGATLEGGLRLYLASRQWLDGGADESAWFEQLRASLSYLLADAPGGAPVAAPAPAPAPDPPKAAPVRPTNAMADDDPRWRQHSGRSAHEEPPWTIADLDRLKPLVDDLPPRTRQFLEVLSASPGVEFSADELASLLGVRGAAGVAAVLSPFQKWKGSERSFPFRWWKGQPSTYAMTHATSEAIRASLG